MRRFLPGSLSGQLILLLVMALVLSQILNTYFLTGERKVIARASHYNSVIERLVDEAERLPAYSASALPIVLAEGPGIEGSIFVSDVNRAHFLKGARPLPQYAEKLTRRLEDAGLSPRQTFAVAGVKRRPRGHLPRPPRGRPHRPPEQSPMSGIYHPRSRPDDTGRPGPGFEVAVFSVELADGVWLNALSPYYSVETITARAIFTTILTLLVAGIGAAFLAHRISKPIRTLGAAAEALGRGEDVDLVPESGARDIRAATAAFNAMQQRLTRTIEHQRATLRAVGHDLRTPLTSLRIRAEDLPDDAGREEFIQRIDDLSDMTNAILGWVKDASAVEQTASVDLTSLIDSIVQDYADRGLDVSFDSPARAVIVSCRRVALRRAIINLVDNALKYGVRARLTILSEDDFVRIRIDDDGPGIPVDRMKDVLVPFTRLEASRNRDTGGMGIGLSIAQSVVQNHGGTLILSNRPEGGLRVVLSLPRYT